MIQGTTPTHHFNIPLDPSIIQRIQVTYAQQGNVLLVKTDADGQMEDGTLQVKLTQDETLLFDEFSSVQIQVRVLTTGGDALASEVIRVPCGAVLDKEVLE